MEQLLLALKKNIFEELVEIIQKTVKDEFEKFKVNFTQSKDEEAIFTLDQTAEILGLVPKTMYTINNRKDISYCKRNNKCFYLKEDIMDYIRKGRIKSKSEIEIEAVNSLFKNKK